LSLLIRGGSDPPIFGGSAILLPSRLCRDIAARRACRSSPWPCWRWRRCTAGTISATSRTLRWVSASSCWSWAVAAPCSPSAADCSRVARCL